MSFAALVLRGLAPGGGTPPLVVAWAGWRLVLTTDAAGNLTAGQDATIRNLVIGDAYMVALSGPVTPNTTISAAVLRVDTPAGVNLFSVNGTITSDGSAGAYALACHLSNAQTLLLSAGLFYRWSLQLTDAAGNEWTPINGATLRPRLDQAV